MMKNDSKKITLLAFLIASSIISNAIPGTVTQFIKIDQFGYKTTDQKIAVISDPQVGYNSALSFSPGATYQV